MFPLRVGLHQQRHVLPRPEPPLRPVHALVHVPRARPRPLWRRCHPRGEFFTHSNPCLVPSRVYYTTSTTLPRPLPVAGRALAPWRERVAQDGPRLDDVARAGAARPDGLLGPLSGLWRWRWRSRFPHPTQISHFPPLPPLPPSSFCPITIGLLRRNSLAHVSVHARVCGICLSSGKSLHVTRGGASNLRNPSGGGNNSNHPRIWLASDSSE